jgi:TonB-linked SusC/RagA family outer membrane protein
MKMKRSIYNILQGGVLRFTLCTLALALSAPTFAQTDGDEEEEVETGIKQPDRSKLRQANYPTMTLRGRVTDQATGSPLAGIQLKALGYDRYSAMTEEDGSFVVKVPTFTTALYVYAPQYLSQQVPVVAGDSTQTVQVKLLSDRFASMYGTDVKYTAAKTAKIDRFGVTVESEIANKLGADVRAIMRSAAADGGATMFIRGLNSITSDAQPLIVIDGIEQDMQRGRTSLHTGQFNNLLANISPDDVEKVTVLKNATALYGARGANGVILIDTKRGHSMATRIDANISAGVQLVPRTPSMMNAAQYRIYATEMMGTPAIQQTIAQQLQRQGLSELRFNFLDDNPNGYYYYTYHNNTDWKDKVYRNAVTQNYSINVQGGDDIGMYNLSVGYVKADNTVRESAFDRMNVRFNTDISILWNLSTKFDISIARTNSKVYDDGLPESFSSGTLTSPTSLALLKSPLVAPYQYNKLINDGKGGFTSLLSDYDDMFSALGNTYSLGNPVALFDNGEGDNKNKAENTYFNVHVAPELLFAKDFKLRVDVSYTLDRIAQRYFRPNVGFPSFEVEGLGTVTSLVGSMYAKEQNFVINGQLDWSRQFGAHGIKAFVGGRYNYFSFDNSDLSTEYRSRQNDKNPVLSLDGYPGIAGVSDVWKTIQWYANVDYNYMNRYFATLTLSTEANSRFGDDASGLGLFGVKWAVFPSVQLGWVLSNESWFPHTPAVNFLRINAGYDISGNDGIDNYAARTSFSQVKFISMANGSQLTNIGNDKIQWETTRKFNVGIESFLFNNRLAVSFDYFLNKTSNLLTLKTFSNPIGGINRYWNNGGKLENSGFEAAISFKPVVAKDWRVELGASVGHYKNKVTQLPDGDYTSSVFGQDNILTSVGNPVALFYGYETLGVFASDAEARAAGRDGYLYMVDNAGARHDFVAGDVHFVDRNGDGRIDNNDKTVIGDPNPDIYGNIFATVNWKNLTLGLGFNYSLGNDVYNYQRSVLNSGATFYNQQVAETGHWRYEGQQAELPRLNYGDPMGNNRFSDRWIENGSYLRLKTVNLTYQLPIPGSWTWLQGLSVWAEAQNLLTFTKYLGSDPEFSARNSVFYQGIDCGNLAQGRAFIAGLKINL